ncbi:MAG: fluoride efflux transporter CrcB [Chthoniobacterales bacterium]
MNDGPLLSAIVIFLGGGLGSVLRFFISLWIGQRFGETFPVGTIAVNVTGCFIIGFLAIIFGTEGRLMVHPLTRMFFLIGILGGFTTFSSFSLQTLMLARDQQWLAALGNVLLSVVLCLIGVWLGYVAGDAVNRWR